MMLNRRRFFRRKYGIRDALPNPEHFSLFRRASQHVICEVCGWDYWHHPAYPLAPALTILCNGDLVKL